MVLLSLSNKTPGLYLEPRGGTKHDVGGKEEESVSSCYSEIRLKGLRKKKSKILMHTVTFRVMIPCILVDGSQPRSGLYLKKATRRYSETLVSTLHTVW
jgi:hypothetical protein